ncbi:hypothetical protein B0675_02420 [Streptomyces sp. M41(2017)]|uniref:hypothetical protein n=1 Tax=Streptomyces sp. M41(2017) TaxID=1955065 RepID=UPI0009C06B62|nr:hypothetical protein [Streptomyces sp. M41(2017)]OQQ16158.1 hypothetical protein B0675_02420 [Streptomyces sp. M41(2017)]
MNCARCDRPILPGQPSTTFPVDSASAGGADVTVHAELCDMPAHQTAPDLTGSQIYAAQLRAAAARVSRYAP